MQAYSSVSDCPTTIGPPVRLTFEAVRGLLKRDPSQLPAKLLKRSCLVFIPGSFSLLKGNPPDMDGKQFQLLPTPVWVLGNPTIELFAFVFMYSLAQFDTLYARCQFTDLRTHIKVFFI